MSKPTDDELKKITDIRSNMQEVADELSENHLRFVIMKQVVERLEKQFSDLVFEEEKVVQELIKKYGEGVLDIKSGEIQN